MDIPGSFVEIAATTSVAAPRRTFGPHHQPADLEASAVADRGFPQRSFVFMDIPGSFVEIVATTSVAARGGHLGGTTSLLT